MSDEREPVETAPEGRTVNMLVGLFLSCFGLFMLLLGGGCGVMLLASVFNSSFDGMAPFLLLALGVAGAGGYALYHGVKMIGGRR